MGNWRSRLLASAQWEMGFHRLGTTWNLLNCKNGFGKRLWVCEKVEQSTTITCLLKLREFPGSPSFFSFRDNHHRNHFLCSLPFSSCIWFEFLWWSCFWHPSPSVALSRTLLARRHVIRDVWLVMVPVESPLGRLRLVGGLVHHVSPHVGLSKVLVWRRVLRRFLPPQSSNWWFYCQLMNTPLIRHELEITQPTSQIQLCKHGANRYHFLAWTSSQLLGDLVWRPCKRPEEASTMWCRGTSGKSRILTSRRERRGASLNRDG